MTSPNVENDPLTASSWPTDAESVLDPHTTELPLAEESAQVRRSVPKPPDVDEILRGEYTGWVPVIKAGESQVDAEERARARIRRIEAELDAEEDTGVTRSVSMWMTESMAVKLPAPAAVPEQSVVVLPAATIKPATPDTVRSIHDILDPPWERGDTDSDKVLSPAEALDEARRRIRQMRVDLENNVEMVTRSFEHSVFQVPLQTGLPVPQLFDEPVLPDEDVDYPPVVRVVVPQSPALDVPQRQSASPRVAPQQPPSEPSADMDAIADAIEAAMDISDEAAQDELREVLASFSKRTTEPMGEISTDIAAPLVEPVVDDTVVVATAALEEGAIESPATMTTVPVQPDLAPRIEAQVTETPSATGMADLRDALETSPMATAMPPSPVVDLGAPPPAPMMDDAEAQFLADLLSTLDEVEATVTELANTTALDDVLAKYADLLNSDTSHQVTPEELREAREVQQKAAEARIDLDAMLRTLKAAAETFAEETASPGDGATAAMLQGLLAGAASGAAPTASPTDSVIAATPTASSAPPVAEPQQPGAAEPPIQQPATQTPDIPSPAAAEAPDLVRRVASALRPIDLPPQFRGEPKRMTAAEQEALLRRGATPPPKDTFVREPGGPRADSAEESEIDKIIEAAAERSADPRVRSFWDDEDADMPATAPPDSPSMATSRPEPPEAPREGDAFYATSQPATTYLLSEQAPQDHSLELVIMRDEIRDLRDRLDSSQKLVEDLMLRLANLTEIALQHRSN